MKKINHKNLTILTLYLLSICFCFGCIFGSKTKTPIISPPTKTVIPIAIPIKNIQKNIPETVKKSEDSIPKTNQGILKILLTNECIARYRIKEHLVRRNLPNDAIGETK